MKNFRAGAASFYIVAIATLLFSVIAISFASLVISEIRRTSDNDLSQSAYDSALAGFEDAKAAYTSYINCINAKATASDPDLTTEVGCSDIIYYMEHPDCDMVAHILGRIPKSATGEEVIIKENYSSSDGNSNGMEQAYTCVKIKQNLIDYRSTINSTNASRLVKVNFSNSDATNISSIRLSWYSDKDGTEFDFTNFDGSNVVFPFRSSKLSTPPTVSVQLIQTSLVFGLDDFAVTKNDQTDRGTIFLVPTGSEYTGYSYSAGTTLSAAMGTGNNKTYRPAYDSTIGTNRLNTSAFLKSNDKTAENLPYLVYCPSASGKEFACSVQIDLPRPVGDGSRSGETFAFIISLPYGGPDTDFALAYCNTSGYCTDRSESSVELSGQTEISVTGAQVEIDSTGRANDLFRRVSARIDTYDSNYPYPEYAIELVGGDSNQGGLIKNIVTTCEYGITEEDPNITCKADE